MTDYFGQWQPVKRTGNDAGSVNPKDLKGEQEALRDRPSDELEKKGDNNV